MFDSILFYFIRNKNKNPILRMQYPSFTRIWVCIVSLFSSFKASFFSHQGQWIFSTVTTVDDWLSHWMFWLTYHQRGWPVVQISVIIGSSNPSLCIFSIWWVAGWHRSIRRPPRPEDDDRNNIDKHRDNGDHYGAVEKNTGESNRADCYPIPFANTTIWYVVAAMV